MKLLAKSEESETSKPEQRKDVCSSYHDDNNCEYSFVSIKYDFELELVVGVGASCSRVSMVALSHT